MHNKDNSVNIIVVRSFNYYRPLVVERGTLAIARELGLGFLTFGVIDCVL